MGTGALRLLGDEPNRPSRSTEPRSSAWAGAPTPRAAQPRTRAATIAGLATIPHALRPDEGESWTWRQRAARPTPKLGPALAGEVLPAVGRQRRAGDEGRAFAGQERHRISDFRGLAETPDRDAGDDRLQHVFRHRGDHVGVDVAGADGVDGDALAGAFLGQRLGEAD